MFSASRKTRGCSPRWWTRGSTSCGIPPAPRTGLPPRRKSSAWPGPRKVHKRDGMFWRFVALMELARAAEAESVVAAFHRAAAAAGDVRAVVMATRRQAMFANLRGAVRRSDAS